MNYPKDFVTSSLVSVLLLSGVIVFDKDPLDLITVSTAAMPNQSYNSWLPY